MKKLLLSLIFLLSFVTYSSFNFGFGTVSDNYSPYANLAAFPASGSNDVIYVAEDTDKIYRWTGAAYTEIGGGASIQVPLQQQAFVAKSGNDGTGTVGRVDLAYLTIQAAIDAITDATTTKRYVVKVAPGDYAENIIMKNYVYLEGESTAACRITGTSGTLVTMADTNSRIAEFSLNLTTAANGSECIDATAGGFVLARNMDYNIDSATNGAICQFIDVDCDLLIMADFAATATMTGSSAGANVKNYFNINGSTVTSIARFSMTINDDDVDDFIVGILNSSTNRVDIIAENIELNCTNAAFTGLAAGYSPFGTGASINNFQCDSLILNSSGNGTGYGIYMNSGATGEAIVRKSNITVSGFTNNYAYFISATDTLYCFLNLLDAAQGNQINGSLKGLCIDKINDELSTSFDFDITGDLDASGTITGGTLTDGTISITGGNLTGATGVTATNLTGTLQTAAQTNITSVGSLTSLDVSGGLTTGGGITSTVSASGAEATQLIVKNGSTTAGAGSIIEMFSDSTGVLNGVTKLKNTRLSGGVSEFSIDMSNGASIAEVLSLNGSTGDLTITGGLTASGLISNETGDYTYSASDYDGHILSLESDPISTISNAVGLRLKIGNTDRQVYLLANRNGTNTGADFVIKAENSSGNMEERARFDQNNDLTLTGGLTAGGIVTLERSDLTISSGSITPTKSYHRIDTESAAATDDLTTITAGSIGDTLILQTTSSDRDITVVDGGNLLIAGDFVMDSTQDRIMLICDGTNWVEISRSNNL